jgi:dTDP-4-amino-4,6-dideoxygalactose transaminase
MINVTKTFLPPIEEYTKMLSRAWEKAWITNNGELVQELEEKLRSRLRVKNLLFCNNGTTVIQLAIKVLNLTSEIITTPFSYVATTTAILWENCTPIFVDISENDFCIDTTKIEEAITERTQAILATHVYGIPCDVRAIEIIAKKHNLKVIYDGAHAFGTEIDGRSILDFGDLSTCSFHATKIFHTGEGGCIVTSNDDLAQKLVLYSHFGHRGDDYFSLGINGKNSEMHAAMGLCNLKYIDSILERRKEQWIYYQELFGGSELEILKPKADIKYNYAYFPLVFSSEKCLLLALERLRSKDVIPRRYFYPALNTLTYVQYQSCPVAEDIARRVICLPLYYELKKEEQNLIVDTILGGLI